MFVQTAHYIERHKAEGKQMNLRAYGVEKTGATVKLAKMNLVLNNVRGTITEANSYYRDPYDSFGNFDYVMANPPFNVDEVEPDGVKDQVRFNTYGVPQNKTKNKKKDAKETVPNANYLWINQFATALVEMAVVISEEDDEETKFAAQGLSIKPHRDRMNKVDENGFDIEDNFKNPDHTLQLVFVCAKWLTGFDAPSVSTLYLDKPMKGHTLMQTIARANRVYKDKKCGLIIDYLDVFKYLKRALVDYASDDGGLMPVKDIGKLLSQLCEAIDLTRAFCLNHNVDLSKVIENGDTFRNLSLFEDYANIIVGNDDVKNEFSVMANTVDNLYESLRPDIFKMDFEPAYKDAILYLKGVIDGKIRPEKMEAAQARINELLDQSVITAADARKYTIAETGKELDLSKLDIDELRAQFKKLKNKNLEITNLRRHMEEKLRQMLRRNMTRTKFAERFRNIIDEYNAGGSQNDDFYEKLLKLMEELRAEEERHIKEELSEAELELFDLLRKEHLTAEEEKRVKLAARELFHTLTEKRSELFIVGWQNDPQPKERVKGEIVHILNKYLPESYDREIFLKKSTLVFDHIVDQAMTGYNWVA